jgi:uncharacterized OB-fold protein
MSTGSPQQQVPLVDYLALAPEPHLVANECVACGARFFDRRVACASCFGQRFRKADIATAGEVTSFTIVTFGPPGVDVPYVAALVDCGGTTVRGNLVGIPPDPEHVRLGMPVELTTFSLGNDAAGTEAVGFGFAPARNRSAHGQR